MFARGNCHVVRLAVPIHILFQCFSVNENVPDEEMAPSQAEHTQSPSSVADDESSTPSASQEEPATPSNGEDQSETSSDAEDEDAVIINAPAIRAANAVVHTCLHQVCK